MAHGSLSRRASYAAAAALLALGAPAGLAVLRSFHAGSFGLAWLLGELSRDAATYLYVALSTVIAFSALGYVLGLQADRLYELSSTDPLTGLKNRRIAQERLDEEFVRAGRYGSGLSLLLIDLDGLKALNDKHGHRGGDLALRSVAAAIRSVARASDVVARWGGDEFVLLAPHAGLDEARQLAERIRGFTVEDAAGPAVTISVGVACFDACAAATPESLVRAADAALYAAKHAGRNRVVVA